MEERKARALKSEELEDVTGAKPSPMTEEELEGLLKGHKFHF